MGFPTEFPTQATQCVLRALLKREFKDPILVLAGYDLLGYGLGQALGDVKYLMQIDADTVLVAAELAQEVPVTEVLTEYQRLKGLGLPAWIIIIQLVAQYGPKVIEIIRKFINRNRGN